MRVRELAISLAAAALSAAAAAASAPPAAVSPGGLDRSTSLRGGCPAFSWTQVAGARGYELVVFRLAAEGPEARGRESSDPEAELVQPEPVLRQKLPGGASSWTPDEERCLAPGTRHAWLVRALNEEGSSEWSEPRLFRVVAGPSQSELQAALAILGSYFAGGGRLEQLGLVSESEVDTRGPSAATVGRAPARARTGARAIGAQSTGQLAAPDAVAIRGSVPDPTGLTFGLHGISASTDASSAGAVGESTATSGATIGVLGEVDSAAGAAGVFDNTAGGTILSGRNNAAEVFGVDGAGNVAVSGLVDGVDVGAHAATSDAHHPPPTALPPTGPAGGDLAGTFPNPGVEDDSHLHTVTTVPDLWVNEGGDIMTGTLTLDAGVDIDLSASSRVLREGSSFIHGNLANTAIGHDTLGQITAGVFNTASGFRALFSNSVGSFNSASGCNSLLDNSVGSYNSAVGYRSLQDNTSGDRNVGIGFSAGRYATTGNDNIYLGSGAEGLADDDHTIRIGGTEVGASDFQQNRTFINGIRGVTVASAATVMIDGDTGQLGTASCGSYMPALVCPLGNGADGPTCDHVPPGSFCESDGECGLDNNLNNCGIAEWYFRTD